MQILFKVAQFWMPFNNPSPITEQTKELVEINSHLIRNEIATYIFRVKGNAMINAGIFDVSVFKWF